MKASIETYPKIFEGNVEIKQNLQLYNLQTLNSLVKQIQITMDLLTRHMIVKKVPIKV